jgi:hypothetical protein
MIVTNELISMNYVEDRLTAQDDPGVWKEILAVLGEEFLQRYRAERGEKESWFLRIGACSHWVRPHQSRWIAAGGFALPIGYKGSCGWSNGLPEFDWSVVLSFDGERWTRVDRFSGKKQIVLRVAVPARTARHKQAAVHTMWSTSYQMTLYGFRNVDQKWLCVAASDERKHGRILYAEAAAA